MKKKDYTQDTFMLAIAILVVVTCQFIITNLI